MKKIKQIAIFLILACLVTVSTASLAGNIGTVAKKNTGKKYIYLTFDDGPADVTRTIVDVLNKHEVKATFFINGVHLLGKGGEAETHALDSLIYAFKSGEVVGNHSWDHMLDFHHCNPDFIPGGSTGSFFQKFCEHDYAVSAYFNPTVDYALFSPLNSDTIRDMIYDPEYKILDKPVDAQGHYLDDHLSDLARLPYTNNWRVINADTKENIVLNSAGNTNSVLKSNELADKLSKNGYSVYGWDYDWGPTNWSVPVSEVTETLVNAEKLQQDVKALYTSCPSTALYVCSELSSNPIHKNKVIILTHDFFFEKSYRGDGTKNLVQLDKFITEMKNQGYVFSTLDKYMTDKA